MAQEYFINSQILEDKIRTSLPAQGGAGAGFDLSASTQIIPIIDLTESAEGSVLRQDLQTSLSFNDVTAFEVYGATTTLITTTGYFRLTGVASISGSLASEDVGLIINDGSTDKIIFNVGTTDGSATAISHTYDFIVFLSAGDSLKGFSGNTRGYINGVYKQIASIDGTLTTPS